MDEDDKPKKDAGVLPRKEDFEFLQLAPPGFRFCPTDRELINSYLNNKLKNKPLPINKIIDVNIYNYEPDKLIQEFRAYGENEQEWYFFTPRDRKYRNGSRPNRSASNGYWKATGADINIVHKGVKIGSRQHLVYHRGTPLKNEKTNWNMNEFISIMGTSRKPSGPQFMKLDDWVLCKIYDKLHKRKRARRGNCLDTIKKVEIESSDAIEEDVEHECQYRAPPTPIQKSKISVPHSQLNQMSTLLVQEKTSMGNGFMSSSSYVDGGTCNNPQQDISHGGYFQNPTYQYYDDNNIFPTCNNMGSNYHLFTNHGTSNTGLVFPANLNSQPVKNCFNNTPAIANDVNQDFTGYLEECYDELQYVNVLDIFTGELPPYETGLYHFEETPTPPSDTPPSYMILFIESQMGYKLSRWWMESHVQSLNPTGSIWGGWEGLRD